MRMTKSKLNLLIDAIMMLLLMAMSGLGLLIKYVLVPGFKRNALYGSEVELYFLGLDRHQWGTVHMWISFAFLLLILLHIILHWKMIGCIFKQMTTSSVARKAIVVSLVFFMLLFGIAPLFVKPEIAQNEVQYLQQRDMKTELNISTDSIIQQQSNHETKTQKSNHHKTKQHKKLTDWENSGATTLAEVAAKYGIPEEKLAKALGIPIEMSTQKIGRLKRVYDFDTETLKNEIIQIINNQ